MTLLLSLIAAAAVGAVTAAWLIVVCARAWIRGTAQRARVVAAQGRELRRQWRQLDELLSALPPDPATADSLPPSWARHFTTELAILIAALRVGARRS